MAQAPTYFLLMSIESKKKLHSQSQNWKFLIWFSHLQIFNREWENSLFAYKLVQLISFNFNQTISQFNGKMNGSFYYVCDLLNGNYAKNIQMASFMVNNDHHFIRWWLNSKRLNCKLRQIEVAVRILFHLHMNSFIRMREPTQIFKFPPMKF